MKIVADLSRVVPGRTSPSSIVRPQGRPDALAGGAPSSRGGHLAGMDRRSGANNRLMEALSIAQMAVSVLNNAIVISSRLRNIAQDALAHRKVNYAELTAAGAQLNSTLGEFANRYSVLVIPPPIQGATREGNNASIRFDSDREPLPLRDYAASITRAISGVGEGRAPDLKAIEGAMELMQQKAERIGVMIDVMTREGMPPRLGSIMPADVSRMAGEASARIPVDFNTALSAQGNLRREHIAALLGE